MDKETSVKTYLQNLGLPLEAADVYIALFMIEPASALQISRQTKQARTQVYRHLDALKNMSLVSAEKLSYGTRFRTLPLENIEGELASRDADTAKLRSSLDGVLDALRQMSNDRGRKSVGVQHYYGLSGVKQANWNLTKADKEYFVLEVAHLTSHLDETFGRRHRERCMERGLASHDLTNSKIVTKAELEPFDPAKTHYRYIDPKILTINFEMYIYNDVITLLDYDPKQMHAIEIHHPALNALMRQIYNALWGLGEPITLQ